MDSDLTPRYSMKRMRDEIARAKDYARREALEEAAKLAETLAWSSTETKIGDIISTERVTAKIAARKISVAIRSLAKAKEADHG